MLQVYKSNDYKVNLLCCNGEHLEVTEPFFETIQNRTGDSLEHTEQNKRYYRCIKLFIIKSSVEADATFRALFDISSYGKKKSYIFYLLTHFRILHHRR